MSPGPEDKPQDEPKDDAPPPAGDERTVFMPSPAPAARSASEPTPPPPAPPAPEQPVVAQPAPAPTRVAVGAVLNHIYEVRRFIARGGMGEVYEGVNVNTDERVAIKVMLPHLAADPNVQAMFRKEARTLTRLSHPAVVQYRVLAQEPTLGVFYIVTEFIQGEPLGDLIGRYQPTAAQIEQLTRRLASGLNAAHELGAIHRDMSPDNVLLEDGKLDQAKVIDFGIAKDLDPSGGTIVGDGFAGKLGYVAPEQFGDFDRAIGPWTDVYSLALVMLAFANGKPVDMGATLVEAIDKRRKGPDLSILPASLRPVFAGMLAPDPQKRFRSMGAVLAALDGAPSAPATVFAPAPAAPSPPAAPPRARSGPPMGLLIGAGVGVLVIGGGIAALVMLTAPKPGSSPAPVSSAGGPAPATIPAADPAVLRQALQTPIRSTPCSWLNVTSASASQVTVAGVAGDAAAAGAAVSSAVNGKAAADTSAVVAAAPAACVALDTFRAFRDTSFVSDARLDVPQSTPFPLQDTPQDCPAHNAKAQIDLRIDDPSGDFALVGMEPTGRIQKLFNSRADFNAFRAQAPQFVQDLGNDSYRVTICTDQVGAAGILLIRGSGPFATGAPDKPALPSSTWAQAFSNAAKAGAWQTEMVWYQVSG
ncbi:MAG TPA: serine/threonine-protein kinase [Caulobacteraceae bacterium]|nr:serine/threonine-protein kinase [Caulobacteraceae bacterium]